MSYRMIDDASGTVRLGLVAQDVQTIIPELVVEDSAGMLSVNYLELIPVLTKAMQEQQEQIGALQGTDVGDHVVEASTAGAGGSDWAMPSAIAALALGLFAVAYQLMRRTSVLRSARLA